MNSNAQQTAFLLKSKGIDIKDYDYINGKTDDKKVIDRDKPFVMYGRRFYQNPYLWSRIMELNYTKIIDSILNQPDFIPDILVVRACLGCGNKDNKYPIIVMNSFLDHTINESDKQELIDTVDCVFCSVVESGRFEVFEKILQFINYCKVEPKYKTWGNAGNGDALYYSIDADDSRIALRLMQLGADPSLNDSMAFVKACKKAKYRIANVMIDKGIDIHTKNDLALRMIERNDSNNIVPKDEKEYRLSIINKFIKEKVV